jgi:hypothetical protein
VERLGLKIDPFPNDPGHWAASLVTLAEIMIPCLDAAGAKSVVEVGAYAGDLTGLLLEWAAGSGARIWAIDPSPRPELMRLDGERTELELVREASLQALGRIPLPDAVVIDGDHNYYTVSEELRTIGERAPGAELPLLMFHDVCWPHGRRDDYFAPDAIPDEHRQPIHEGGRVYPGVSGLRSGGLPYRWPAAREGGPRNGVLTAVEDFVEGREGLRLAVVPAFFGLGVVWHRDARWSEAVAEVIDPWDSNPLLARLEANRVLHLASSQYQLMRAVRAEERSARQEQVLRRLLDSSAFALAERLSRLRVRARIAPAHSAITKQDLRRAVAD